MKFFKLVDGVLQLDKDEIGAYKVYDRLLRRDKGSYGDAEGRKKLHAFKEFKYIYFTCDYEAYPQQHGYSPKEAHEYAIAQTGLDKNWVPDQEILDAMEVYKEEHLSEAKQSIVDLIKILRLNRRTAGKVHEAIEEKLNAKLSPQEAADIISYQSRILEIATNIPKQIKQLTEALAIIEELDKKDVKLARGKKEIKPSMNPNNDIES